jgi:hypothetical protein
VDAADQRGSRGGDGIPGVTVAPPEIPTFVKMLIRIKDHTRWFPPQVHNSVYSISRYRVGGIFSE